MRAQYCPSRRQIYQAADAGSGNYGHDRHALSVAAAVSEQALSRTAQGRQTADRFPEQSLK